MFGGQIEGISEEKMPKFQLFFLVGPDSSTSEDSSTIEYSACALRAVQNFLHIKLQNIKIKIAKCHWTKSEV